MSGFDPALSPAVPRSAPRWSTTGDVMPGIDELPASMAGLPASRAMVRVGPPSSASAARPGLLTLIRLPLTALNPPEPPLPNRLVALVRARLPIASLGLPAPYVLRATIVL